MSDKRLQLDDARRHLASAKCSSGFVSLGHVIASLDSLLAAHGDKPDREEEVLQSITANLESFKLQNIALAGEASRLRDEIAEVCRQHDQTRAERDRYAGETVTLRVDNDRLAKRVAELEDVVRVARNGLDDILPDSALHPTEAGA